MQSEFKFSNASVQLSIAMVNSQAVKRKYVCTILVYSVYPSQDPVKGKKKLNWNKKMYMKIEPNIKHLLNVASNYIVTLSANKKIYIYYTATLEYCSLSKSKMTTIWQS